MNNKILKRINDDIIKIQHINHLFVYIIDINTIYIILIDIFLFITSYFIENITYKL